MLRAAGSRVDLRCQWEFAKAFSAPRGKSLCGRRNAHSPSQTCQADPGYIPGTRPAGRARRGRIVEVLDKYYTSVRGGDGGMIA